MRTIKFRGYNAKNKKWLYGYYFVNRGEHFITPDEEYRWPYPSADDFLVDPESIGQFTGLRDVNGKEIYEGDIIQSIRYPEIWHYVHYDEENACFRAKNTEYYSVDCCLFKDWLDNHHKEVIGNIHDNPELLKTKDHEEDNVQ